MLGIILVAVVKAPEAYLGPESIMPLASILAAVLGFILIFWRYIVKFFRKIFGKSKPDADITPYVEPEDDDKDQSGSA
jgi:hypothetical protein